MKKCIKIKRTKGVLVMITLLNVIIDESFVIIKESSPRLYQALVQFRVPKYEWYVFLTVLIEKSILDLVVANFRTENDPIYLSVSL